MSKLAQGRLCVIHNNVAEASVKLEVSEQRVIAYLTSLINREDEDFHAYPIAVKDLAATLNLSRKDFYKEVKETTKSLTKKGMTLRRLDGPGELQVAWLSSAEYKDGEGIVELEFSPKLKPYLLQLKAHFVKYPLRDVIRFKSQFSMPLYLLLKQHLKMGYREFNVDDLKQKLELVGKYSQYGIFKLKVLKVATKEINDKTSLYVDFTEIREGRKIVAVRFVIKSKPGEQKNYEQEMEERGQLPLVNDVPAVADQRPALLIELSEILGDDAEAAAFWKDGESEDYCRANLDYARAHAKKNIAGYLRKSLTANWARWSEAVAVAATEQPGKPNPDCPKCHGTGSYVGKSPTGFDQWTSCDCKK